MGWLGPGAVSRPRQWEEAPAIQLYNANTEVQIQVQNTYANKYTSVNTMYKMYMQIQKYKYKYKYKQMYKYKYNSLQYCSVSRRQG